MLTPAQLSELDGWLNQYVAASASLEAGGVQAVRAAYAAIEDWFRPGDTLAASLAAMAAAQTTRQAVAGLTSQYIAQVLRVMTGSPVRVLSRPSSIPEWSRGVNPFHVYSRPVFDFRRAIEQAESEVVAEAEALLRAEVLAIDEAVLARRDGASAEMDSQLVTHYRRIIRPELSESGTCGMCVVASDKIYTFEELLPIHDRCKCLVMPIVGDDDPGFRLNEGDLGRLYGDAGGTTRQLLKKTRYVIEQHGELGPILVPAPGSSPYPTAA